MSFDPNTSPESPPPRVLVSGAGGLIGSALAGFLTAKGYQVAPLVRAGARGLQDVVDWDPAAGHLDGKALAGFDAVIHLAGEPIVGRWTREKKRRIRDSRVDSTALLARTLATLPSPPRTLLCASAIGIYGDRGDELLDERSAPGEGFLAAVGRDWEAAAEPAARAGIRVVHLRFGVVLSSSGGALASMLPPFKAGLGGRLGSGRQFMSWVSLDDTVGAIHHALTRDDLRGAVNVVSPQPITNREFTATLGRVLSRPTLLPAPAPMLRLLLGEMADSLLLSSARVLPRELTRHDYLFQHPDLEGALRHLLERRN